METSASDNNSNRDIEIVKAVLASGNSVELPASGFSMFPTFLPGDVILVRPLAKGEIPEQGRVVVCLDNGVEEEDIKAEDKRQKSQDKSEEKRDRTSVLVMHRLMEIIGENSEKPIFITRGDSRTESDQPYYYDQLLGVAARYKRGLKENDVKTFIPGNLQYRLNSWLLWVYGKYLGVKRKV